MSNYNGLMQVTGLILGTVLSWSVAAADDASSVEAPESATTEATSASVETAPAPAADAPAIKSTAPLRYVVKHGDTLWGIAGYFLKNPWQWPEIWYSNDQIKNPHRIYPGNVLRLVMIGGKPRLVMGDEEGTPKENGPLKLSPKIRSRALEAAIPTIPMEAIRDFLKAPQMIQDDDLDNTPRIVEFTDNHIVGGSDTGIFVKGIQPNSTAFYKIVRKGDAYRDPETDKILGYEAVPVGSAEVKRIDKKIAIATVTEATHETRIGDNLIPVEDEANYDAYFYPRAPEADIVARIVSVFDGASQIGQYQIVSLNRGREDGLAPGHVLTVMQAGRTARDPDSWTGRSLQLPDTEAGTVMVFKVMPHFSYALVMDATRAIHAADKAINPH